MTTRTPRRGVTAPSPAGAGPDPFRLGIRGDGRDFRARITVMGFDGFEPPFYSDSRKAAEAMAAEYNAAGLPAVVEVRRGPAYVSIDDLDRYG